MLFKSIPLTISVVATFVSPYIGTNVSLPFVGLMFKDFNFSYLYRGQPILLLVQRQHRASSDRFPTEALEAKWLAMKYRNRVWVRVGEAKQGVG